MCYKGQFSAHFFSYVYKLYIPDFCVHTLATLYAIDNVLKWNAEKKLMTGILFLAELNKHFVNKLTCDKTQFLNLKAIGQNSECELSINDCITTQEKMHKNH